MNIRIYGLCCLAAGFLFASEAVAEELYSTPITAASVDSREGDRWWGPGGSLIPEAEWCPYVGRKQAFSSRSSGCVVGADPARMASLGSMKSTARSGGSSKKASTAKTSAAKPAAPKPDPCAEKVRQALEEAARTGKIPASAAPSSVAPSSVAPLSAAPTATPQATGQAAPAVVTATAPSASVAQTQAGPASAVSTQGPSVAGSVVGSAQAVPPTPPVPAYPYSSGTSSVAPAGTAAQGVSSPNPVMAGPPLRSQPPFSVE